MSASLETTVVPGPRALHKLETALLVAATVCILVICALIFSGIISRAVFGWALRDSEIMVRELMIGSIILPLAYVTAHRAHISVEVFTNLMPDSFQPGLNFLSSLIGFLVLLPIAYGGYVAFVETWVEGAYFFGEYDLPEWPGRFAFFIGYIVFVLRLLVLTIVDFLSFIRPSRHDKADESSA